VPQPRTAIAEALGAHASAAMDVSDGLAGDLAKLCRVSRVATEIEVERLPLSRAALAALAKEPALIETIITGGDDYEVLACVPAGEVAALRRAASAVGIALTEIGTVAAGEGQARFLDAQGKPLELARPAFSHF
jgi:thiamine-monophosphate kinase